MYDFRDRHKARYRSPTDILAFVPVPAEKLGNVEQAVFKALGENRHVKNEWFVNVPVRSFQKLVEKEAEKVKPRSIDKKVLESAARMEAKAQRNREVVAYAVDHPELAPAVVAERFGITRGTLYKFLQDAKIALNRPKGGRRQAASA